jgi:hypothetical protein
VVNNPGDLRIPVNFLIYGGGILYVALLAAIPGMIMYRKKHSEQNEWNGGVDSWALWVGIWYLAVTGYHMKEAPDARFFLPGIVLVLLPVSQVLALLPSKRIWLPVLVILSLFQGSLVLHKVYRLRHVPVGVREAIEYFRVNTLKFNRVFMYPEGNYRLFPCEHEWYLEYQLKDFWKADNDSRIAVLNRHRIGAIVVKKSLVGKVDKDMNNLGIYPDSFVRDIKNDKRFVRVLDNRDVTVYLVPDSTKTDDEKKQ